MKKKFRIKAQSIKTDKVLDKVCHTDSISNLVALLGSHGYMVQEYYEVDGKLGDTIIQVQTGRG